MNAEIITSNLVKRPVRTGVSVLAVAMEVMLILVIIGLVTGIKTDNAQRTQGVGADIMFQPPGAAMFLGMSQNVMPIEMAAGVGQLEGVEFVTPVITQFNTQDALELVFGIEAESFDQVTGGVRYLAGQGFESADQIVVDEVYAEAKGVGVGDSIELLNHTFEISGIVESGKGARLYIGLEAAQEMTGDVGQASLLFITVVDPDAVDSVIERLQSTPGLSEYKITKMEDYLSLMLSSSVPALDAFLTVVVGVAVSIGLLVIFLSTYTAINERTREIGILRSMGATRSFVVTLILKEAAVLAVAGVIAGIAMSFGVASLVIMFYGGIQILIVPAWVVNATLFAIASSLLGAFYPALRAAGRDPVESLAYE